MVNLNNTNFSTGTPSVCPARILDNCTVWPGTRGQWRMQTLGTLLICVIVMILNTWNLLVFYRWKNKEPYVLFHVSLATLSIIVAFFGLLSPVTRIIDWTRPTQWPFTAATVGVLLGQFVTMANVAVISVDRWISVEYAVAYRNQVSRSKVIWVVMVMVCLCLGHTVPPFVIYRDCILLYCSRQPGFRWIGRSYVVWNMTRGPLLLLVIILTQARICVIAIGAKLKLLRSRNRVQQEAASKGTADRKQRQRLRDARKVVTTIWESVLPGSIVVLGALVSNLPYYLVEMLDLGQTGSPAVMFTVFIFSCQHMQSPFIYLVFFRPYRRAASRVCGFGGPQWEGRPTTNNRSTRGSFTRKHGSFSDTTQPSQSSKGVAETSI